MSRFSILVIIVTLSIANTVQGGESRGKVDTRNGYCDLEEYGYGKIAVGDIGYDDVKCQRILCHKDEFVIQGCGAFEFDDENCELVPTSGNYPKCCPGAEIRCKENN